MIGVTVSLLAICGVLFYFYAHHNWNALPGGTAIDRIVVEKSARKLSIFRDGNPIKTYRIALGRSPVGSKQEEGDMKTPEECTKSTVEIHKAVSICPSIFRIRQTKTTGVRQPAAFQPALTS